MSTNHLPLLIVGCGIGGMTTALALAQKGVDSIVLEQAEEFREMGAAIQMLPNFFGMFEILGIVETIEKNVLYIDNLLLFDGVTGQEVMRMPYGKNLKARFKYPHAIIHREVLLGALIKECEKYDQIKMFTSCRVIDFEEIDDKVIVKTEKGETFEGVALIAAEGIRSKIRNRIVGDGKPLASSVVYRATIKKDKMPVHLQHNDVIHWMGPNAYVIYYPVQKDGDIFYNLLAIHRSSKQHEPEDSIPDLEDLYAHFAGFQPNVVEIIDLVDKSRIWMSCDREPVSQWSKGLVTLLGDAAHPMRATLTQGAGMAIEDAIVLANKIALCKGDYKAAFEAYQEERYLRCARVVLTSRFISDLEQATGLTRELRNQVLSQWSADQMYDYFEWVLTPINKATDSI